MAISRSGERNKQGEINELTNEKIDIERYLVHSKQSLLRKGFAFLLTCLMWGYSGLVFYFFVSGILSYNNSFLGLIKTSFKITNRDIQGILISSLVVFFVSFIILFSWRTYNKKKYGKLNRRKKPGYVRDDEMLSLGLIEEDVYYRLKTEKVISFEKSPVKELRTSNKEDKETFNSEEQVLYLSPK